MAERRMFSKLIIDSDAFLDMPPTTQNLYFHLNMRADDDGFINAPKKIMRMIGAHEDDLKILLSKRYILGFETGIIVIKHWRLHNTIRSDRKKETMYKEELQLLTIKEDGAYTDNAQPNDNQMTTNGMRSIVEYSVDYYSEDKCSINQVSRNQKIDPLNDLMRYWDSKKNLPSCGLSLTLNDKALPCLNVIRQGGFPDGYIEEAIDNISKNKDEILKFCKIPSFVSFMLNGKIGYWHDWKSDEELKPFDNQTCPKEHRIDYLKYLDKYGHGPESLEELLRYKLEEV